MKILRFLACLLVFLMLAAVAGGTGDPASSNQYLMQARSSSNGQLYTWPSVQPDYSGTGFPGPGSPQEITIAKRIIRGDVDRVNVRWFGAKGDGSTDDTAAVNAAITYTLAQSGSGAVGTLYFPQGVYKTTTGFSTIGKAIIIEGDGWGTQINVTGTVAGDGGLVPAAWVFKIAPTGSIQIPGATLREMYIYGTAGSATRGIILDGSAGVITHFNMWHVFIDPTSLPTSVYATGSGLAQGTPALADIGGNSQFGGLTMTAAGDTVRITHCNMAGAGKALDITAQGGASTMLIEGNNITSKGGMRFGATFGLQILSNEIEVADPFTGSNGAIIDLDGDGSGVSAVQSPIIRGNSFQVPGGVSGVPIDSIRVNFATNAIIEGNLFQRGKTPPSHDIIVTANAVDTHPGDNEFLSGLPVSAMVSNAGTRTVFNSKFLGKQMLGNNTPLASVDENGNEQSMLFTAADGHVELDGLHGGTFLTSTSTANNIHDINGTVEVAITPTTITIGGNGVSDKKVDGRSALFLSFAAECLASGTNDRFSMWNSGIGSTCTTLCATISAATCVKGMTLDNGTVNKQYGTECGTADPSGGGDANITGKLCCCTGSGSPQSLWR